MQHGRALSRLVVVQFFSLSRDRQDPAIVTLGETIPAVTP